MAERNLSWLGIDRIQWQALVVAYLRMDGRRAGGASRPGRDRAITCLPPTAA